MIQNDLSTIRTPNGELSISTNPPSAGTTNQPSDIAPLLTREDILKKIVGYELKPIFKHQHLNREVIIGLVGLRGDGKSGSGAVIALLDYLMNGEPVWSNMAIGVSINVDDKTVCKWTNGIIKRGGTVGFP